ncbi:MAG: hypothetical protein OXF07_12515 [Rhodobacter sp.]|nr:hypothetical protein [Rhodobacter sp.]MCY4169382.1 hypothetical protein [Rhodobacter sp.]
MSDAPDIHALSERVNTHQAAYETALERMERRAEARDKASLWRLIVLLAIGFGVSTTVLGLILS